MKCEKKGKNRKIPLCARSEVVKEKYPGTCPIHIIWADVICCAFTEIWSEAVVRLDRPRGGEKTGMSQSGILG
jgi:hypothetical protein